MSPTRVALASSARRIAAPGAIAGLMAFTLLAGCSGIPASSGQAVSDPLEGVNRAVFTANDVIDIVLIEPASIAYETVMPPQVRDVVRNVIGNVREPVTTVNALLQGDGDAAAASFGRFMTNTILGLGGIADVATQAGLPQKKRDFGQTLGGWGVDAGPYLVLPLLGPSTARDAAGLGLESMADPLRIGLAVTDTPAGQENRVLGGRAALSGLDERLRNAEVINDVKRNSIDRYATMRSLYLQSREAGVRDIAPEVVPNAAPEFPDFGIGIHGGPPLSTVTAPKPLLKPVH